MPRLISQQLAVRRQRVQKEIPMKVTTTAGKLLAIVASVTGIIARANTLPILGNVLIKCEADSVSVTGTDLEVTVRTRSEMSEIEDGASTIPAAKLVSILGALPEAAKITLSTSDTDSSAILKAGKSRYSLRTLPYEDYPTTVLKSEALGGVKLLATDLKAALERVASFMAVNDVRYCMNGMFIDTILDGVRMVATDGHRMSKVDVACEGEKRLSRGIIVPGKTVKLVLRLLPKSGDVKIIEYENVVLFDLGDTKIHSKTIAAQYPDYKRVLPERDELTTVNRSLLLDALSRGAILCNERFRAVTLFPQAGRIVIRSTNESQEEGEEEVEAAVPKTASCASGFNVDYLLGAVQVAKGDDLRLGFAGADASLLFLDSTCSSWRAVVMPMRV